MPAGSTQINANLNISSSSINQQARKVNSAFSNINLNSKNLNQFNNSLGRITGQASEFKKSMDAATARVFAFGASVTVINAVSQSFKALVASTIEVEKRLIEINSIFGATEQQFNRFRTSIFGVAKNTGQAFNIVADGAAELARQGLTAEETAKRLNAALVLTRISGLDSVASVNALTAAINGYSTAALSAEQIVNKLVAVDTAFAVSAQDLAQGFQRAGSTAEDAGVSFDQLLGLITAVQQKTARGGAVIGNAFKSIFTRLSRSTTISELKELGVEIDGSQDGIEKLNALSEALERTADPGTASKIKELAGGVFQINVVSAALKDLSSESSLFASATEKAANATNEAFEKNEQLNKSLATQINSLVVGLTNISERIGGMTLSPILSDLLSLAEGLASALEGALDPSKGNSLIKGFLEGIGAFLRGPGLVIISAAFLNIFKLVSKFALEGFRELMKIGGAQEKIKSIEMGIVQLLTQDAALRKQLANSALTQAQKEQLVIDAIKTENSLLRQQQAIVNALAASASRAGVKGYNPTGGGFKTKKNFASGYSPIDGMMEVAEARSLGATSSVRPKIGDGTISGQKFVMNTQEIEIPNAGRNGDSAVIPLYAKGFMPRYPDGFGARALERLVNKPDREKVNNNPFYTQREKDFARKIGDKYGVGQSIKSPLAISNALKKKRETSANNKAAPLGSPKNRININASNYGFLVPQKNVRRDLSQNSTFQKGKQRYSYSMTGVPVRGPIVPKNVDEAANPQDELLKKNIRESILDSAVNFSKVISPSGTASSRGEIAKNLVKTKGSKGAINSAVGAAFEVATTTSLGIKEASKEGGDFDVKNTNSDKLKKVKTLFGIKNPKMEIMDFKVSSSKGNLQNFAKKIANETFLRKTGGKATKRKARGFMPRFASGKKKPTARSKAVYGSPNIPPTMGPATKRQYVRSTVYGTPTVAPTIGPATRQQYKASRPSLLSRTGSSIKSGASRLKGSSGAGIAASFAIAQGGQIANNRLTEGPRLEAEGLSNQLEKLQEALAGVNKETEPEKFKKLEKEVNEVSKTYEKANKHAEKVSSEVNGVVTELSTAALVLSALPPQVAAVVGTAYASFRGGTALGAANQQATNEISVTDSEGRPKEILQFLKDSLNKPLDTLKNENASFGDKASAVFSLSNSGVKAITEAISLGFLDTSQDLPEGKVGVVEDKDGSRALFAAAKKLEILQKELAGPLTGLANTLKTKKGVASIGFNGESSRRFNQIGTGGSNFNRELKQELLNIDTNLTKKNPTEIRKQKIDKADKKRELDIEAGRQPAMDFLDIAAEKINKTGNQEEIKSSAGVITQLKKQIESLGDSKFMDPANQGEQEGLINATLLLAKQLNLSEEEMKALNESILSSAKQNTDSNKENIVASREARAEEIRAQNASFNEFADKLSSIFGENLSKMEAFAKGDIETIDSTGLKDSGQTKQYLENLGIDEKGTRKAIFASQGGDANKFVSSVIGGAGTEASEALVKLKEEGLAGAKFTKGQSVVAGKGINQDVFDQLIGGIEQSTGNREATRDLRKARAMSQNITSVEDANELGKKLRGSSETISQLKVGDEEKQQLSLLVAQLLEGYEKGLTGVVNDISQDNKEKINKRNENSIEALKTPPPFTNKEDQTGKLLQGQTIDSEAAKRELAAVEAQIKKYEGLTLVSETMRGEFDKLNTAIALAREEVSKGGTDAKLAKAADALLTAANNLAAQKDFAPK